MPQARAAIANFADSLRHQPEAPAELFVVEGDSAANAVCAVRDPQLQAVMPLQGKPMNAMRVSPRRLLTSPWLQGLTQLLGSAPGTALPLGELRYERVILLLDPDADGIHAGALLQIFFYHCMRSLLADGRVAIVHAPWGEFQQPGRAPLLAYSEPEFQTLGRAQTADGKSTGHRIRHRGLGTITPAILGQTCVDPATRRMHVLSLADVEHAVRLFGA